VAAAPVLSAGAHQVRRGGRDAAARQWRLSRRRDGGGGGIGARASARAVAPPTTTTTTTAAAAADDSDIDASSSSSSSKQHKVALFVEPSPFSHVSGMKNRFECLIKGLTGAGDDVVVFTPDRAPPKTFAGASVVGVLGFRLPFYKSATLLLSLGLSLRVLWTLWRQRPDVIHVSTPGVLVFAAVLYSRLFRVPLVMSYHTHIPEYIPRYTWTGLVEPMWSVIRWCTRRADLTLVTSAAMADELARNRCRRKSIDVWQRGVDTDVFHPRFRSAAMRARMASGARIGGGGDGAAEAASSSSSSSSAANAELEDGGAPLLLYVGRLGAEKNVGALKEVLGRVRGTPEGARARLVLVGDGPHRATLEAEFAGDEGVTFMGMMRGRELSEAYASADVLLMPSETETLGFVALEAMASGVPVVAVAAGGLTDIITESGRTGLLYPPKDYAAAAGHAASLVARPEWRRQVGAAGRREVERFGWAAATRKIRESQYVRAIRIARYKLRFQRLIRRVRWGAFWRMVSGLVAVAVAAVLGQRAIGGGGPRSAGGGGGGSSAALAM
jgi:sulfoquinovosyltransferase